jgi:nicotinamide mononucleotide (NMN) deamidase PncC
MARGVSRLRDADVGLALTGIGGPFPVEGQDPGTVWIGVHAATKSVGRLVKVDGQSTSEVRSMSCAAAIDMANEVLELCSGSSRQVEATARPSPHVRPQIGR